MFRRMLTLAAAGLALAGCDPKDAACGGKPAAALAQADWMKGAWLSVPTAPVFRGKVNGNSRAAEGTSWFASRLANPKKVASARWMTAGLGVYDIYVNGTRVGRDFLKPGFTHAKKTKVAFTYDVTDLINCGEGDENVFAAEVSAGWWRDKIVHFAGRKSAFRGALELVYADGTREVFGTGVGTWRCGVGGPVRQAAIFDGETYDARVAAPVLGEGLAETPEVNREFDGEVVPTVGAEITLRCDLAMEPVEAYCWKGVTGADKAAKKFGSVVRTREYQPGETYVIEPGETFVADFGQNCAAVPYFRFKAAEGTVLTALPGEMLNDGAGAQSRGNDGPEGSVYRQNLRIPNDGMRAVYTFGRASGFVPYLPRFTFFGYRYISISATDRVEIETLRSVPVTSITKAMERGFIETGDASVNRLIRNVYWGQLSNYLSVPTDCPQRNERLGWTADTQVFVEAGSFNADTTRFFRKWTRDLRDSQDPRGGYPGVAPSAQYGNNPMRIGWADAGVIVPYQIWKQFGDTSIVEENWAAMEKYLARMAETRYEHKAVAEECSNYQWADWLSFEKFESAGGAGRPQNSAFEPNANGKGRHPKADALVYWDYLGACYWLWDAQMMAAMAEATGRTGAAGKYRKMSEEAKAYVKGRFFASPDGMILPVFRDMQTPALFALKLGFVEGAAREATARALRENIRNNGGCLQTGFLGTSILMDTLTECGMVDVAYDLLFSRKCPGWLYSVDQGATTIWERWNSYVKDTGFGPVGMNSFNHYAYGSVLAWIYKTAAGIAADPAAPGFANVVMKPVPDKRLGHVTAEYETPQGIVRSSWHYEDNTWHWTFTLPPATTATVTLPGETSAKKYGPGTHEIVR